MAIEFFLVPMVGTGTSSDELRGKYLFDPNVLSGGTLRYSRQASALIMMDANQTYLDVTALQADATRISTILKEPPV